jgi:hypothetical protein
MQLLLKRHRRGVPTSQTIWLTKSSQPSNLNTWNKNHLSAKRQYLPRKSKSTWFSRSLKSSRGRNIRKRIPRQAPRLPSREAATSLRSFVGSYGDGRARRSGVHALTLTLRRSHPVVISVYRGSTRLENIFGALIDTWTSRLTISKTKRKTSEQTKYMNWEIEIGVTSQACY